MAAVLRRFPSHQVLMTHRGALCAVANTVPLAFHGPLDELPDTGWDWAVGEAFSGEGRPNLLCGLAVTVAPEHRGRHLSRLALQAMKDTARRDGLTALVAPVRPLVMVPGGIDALVHSPQADGWLKTHVAIGGRVIGPCRTSMTLRAPQEDWRRWGTAGQIGALRVQGTTGEYVEPNIWVEHTL